MLCNSGFNLRDHAVVQSIYFRHPPKSKLSYLESNKQLKAPLAQEISAINNEIHSAEFVTTNYPI